MGRRKAEREGGKGGSRREAGVRECGSRGLRVSPAPESGALAVGGYKRSTREWEREALSERRPVLPHAGQPSVRGPWSLLL
jgi:hypothetical protein